MKSTKLIGSLLVVLASFSGACFDDVPVGSGGGGGGSGSGGSDAGHGASCTSSAQCGSDEICGFATAEACSATGECFAAPGAECDAYSPGCACDGTEINIACNGLPTGYETAPLAHTGACTGGTDAGAGAPCTLSAECGANEICGFEASLACNATGHCFASPGAVCAAYSAGCACDGSEINVACNGLPTGYETAPLAHTGACGADGGTGSGSGGGTGGGTGVACTSTAGCGTEQICGFAEADSCNATGECFVISGVQCNSYLPGCACDGTEINLACNQLPVGYETAPYAHSGACDADAGH
jgi:hypothetical protein